MSSKHGNGRRSRWKDEKGKRRSRTFRLKRDADLFQMRKNAETEEIKAGLRAEKPCKRPFNEACDRWLVDRAPRKRSEKDDISIINKHLRPSLGDKACDEIDESDGDVYANEHDHLSEKTVANHLTLLTSILNHVSRLKPPWLGSVPKFRKPKVSWCSRDYQYLRSDEEISSIAPLHIKANLSAGKPNDVPKCLKFLGEALVFCASIAVPHHILEERKAALFVFAGDGAENVERPDTHAFGGCIWNGWGR